jgi:outer membrane protein assembly factor BamA
MSSQAEARRQQAQEALQRQMQQKFTEHVNKFPISVEFPAKVESATTTPCRTDANLVQHRLLEAGVSFEDSQKVEDLTEAIVDFISGMEKSGCYNAVQVKIGTGAQEGMEALQVVLNEKKWYRLYIGGGLKQESLDMFGETSFPKVQFETSGGLLNLSGNLDTTSLQYAVDQTSATTLSFVHERPLFSILSKDSPLYETILLSDRGSQTSIAFRAVLDTLDHEWTRSYKEYQRLLSLRIANTSNVTFPEASEGGYSGFDWSLLFRDLIPRRHATLPYAMDASPEITSQAGPSLKHSLSYEYRTNGRLCNDWLNPTYGMDIHGKVEVAGPPGDVGFLKLQGGASLHVPLPGSWAFHGAFQTGILQSLSFGGLCRAAGVSDRFYLGGPMQFRGFVPAGIGPRAKTGGASVPGGDALGGDFFYTASAATSVPFPGPFSFLQDNNVRCFGFATVGTLSGVHGVPLMSILRSTRASVGGGICASTPMGRVEATYAMPLRYSPRDARKSVQIGLGFTFS